MLRHVPVAAYATREQRREKRRALLRAPELTRWLGRIWLSGHGGGSGPKLVSSGMPDITATKNVRTLEHVPAPDLSVVLVTHNGRERALATLASARRRLGDVAAEWLVVDSGSTDGTPDAIEQEQPEVRVFRRANIGFAAGNNVALTEAAGRYVLLLNPDVEIVAGTLAELVTVLDERPEVAAASVCQHSPTGQLLPTIRRFPSVSRQLAESLRLGGTQERELDRRTYASERDADWLVGAFLVIRRKALLEIGLLDERFFLYSEETDWCFRARSAGWSIRHVPSLQVVHHQGGYARAPLATQLTYSKILFAEKHYSPVRALGIRGALLAGHVVRLAGSSALAPLHPRWRARTACESAACVSALFRRPPRLGVTGSGDSVLRGAVAA